VNQPQIFILRAILGGILAYVLCQVFRPAAGIPAVIVLAIFLVGLSYVFEYLRKRKSR